MLEIVWNGTGMQLIATMRGFRKIAGLPGVAGDADGCLVEMEKPPIQNGYRFYSYKSHHAMLMLAVVNHQQLFTYYDAR